MLKSLRKYFIFTILIGIFFTANAVSAQTPQDIINSVQNDIQVSLTPQFPKAGDTVNIHLQSYSTPLDGADISWIVNGKVEKSGYGVVDFATKAGRVGSVSKVTVRALTANGATVEKVITIQPADIDLLWQATSYVPPFYQGKALFPHQGLITFVAVPNVSADRSVVKSLNSFIYTWKKDGDVLGDFSGYGKNTFSMRGAIISRPINMTVEVSSVEGISLGSATAYVTPQIPQIDFYENNPLLGVLYNKELSDFTMLNKELSISAIPFYFNTGTEPTNLSYKWSMNGENINSQKDPSIITIRNTTGESGMASVGLRLENTLTILQSAYSSMNISLLGQNNQNVTGL